MRLHLWTFSRGTERARRRVSTIGSGVVCGLGNAGIWGGRGDKSGTSVATSELGGLDWRLSSVCTATQLDATVLVLVEEPGPKLPFKLDAWPDSEYAREAPMEL